MRKRGKNFKDVPNWQVNFPPSLNQTNLMPQMHWMNLISMDSECLPLCKQVQASAGYNKTVRFEKKTFHSTLKRWFNQRTQRVHKTKEFLVRRPIVLTFLEIWWINLFSKFYLIGFEKPQSERWDDLCKNLQKRPGFMSFPRKRGYEIQYADSVFLHSSYTDHYNTSMVQCCDPDWQLHLSYHCKEKLHKTGYCLWGWSLDEGIRIPLYPSHRCISEFSRITQSWQCCQLCIRF